MAQIGVAITKRVAFRLGTQHFTNVYYYSRVAPTSGEAEIDAILQEIIDHEKTWHSTDVTFVEAKLWSAGGSPAENDMLRVKALSGTGFNLTNTSWDRERVVLIRWPAGKDRRGNPVFLRKYYHTCGALLDGTSVSAGVLQNTAALSDSQRTASASQANALRMVGPVADTWSLCSKTGRLTLGDAECHRFLEHHQLGDEWRG